MNRRNQQGIALIIVMLLLAMMVSISAVMSGRLFSQVQSSRHQLNNQQAYWYALSVEAFVKELIARQSEKEEHKGDNADMTDQPWGNGLKQYSLGDATIEGDIKDKQACFNINALSEQSGSDRTFLIQMLQHLLESTGADNYQSEMAAQAVAEFIDSNQTVDTELGVEDSYYESMSPAYLPADSLLADPSELRAVKQVSGKMMSKLAPLVCALPTTEWRLNVNTIEPKQADLLVALFYPYLSRDAAISVIKSRPASGWDSIEEFLKEGSLQNIGDTSASNIKGYLDVMSSYFELDAQIVVDDTRLRVRSLLDSTDRKKTVVIRRRFGGVDARTSDHSTQ